MRSLIIFIIVISTSVYGQDTLKKTTKNNVAGSANTILLEGERYYIFEKPSKGITFKAEDLKTLFKGNTKSVVFFYPEVDSIKRIGYDNQVRQIASNKRFKNSRVIGIPFIESKTDEGNVHLEKYIVTDVQCIVYCENEEELDRALKLNSVFIKHIKDMPANFYRIEINKEALCVKEYRVGFYESLLLELVDPQWSEKEKTTMILKNQEELLKKVEVQSKEIEELKKLIKQLSDQINSTQNNNVKRQ